MIRYCSDWKPDASPSTPRNFTYSLGVSVASTPHCSNSWRWICFTRARPFCAGPRSSSGQALEHGVELVDDQPHPQLRRLVLDDEQQLVVVLGLAERMLGAQQPVEIQIAGVGLAPAQVAGDALFDVPQVVAHGFSASSSSRR